MLERYQIANLQATPIEQVAQRLGLEVRGHKCLCPWHEDRHPSLTFNTYRNRYRCYVCDAHGGVIDLVMNYRHCSFLDACSFLGLGLDSGFRFRSGSAAFRSEAFRRGSVPFRTEASVDVPFLRTLLSPPVLCPQARTFLFSQRHIDPRVVAWCRLSSITTSQPCWRYGRPFYDAPALLIPYFDINGNLLSVQSRYLGSPSTPLPPTPLPTARFRFPRGSNCHIYNLPVLRLLRPNEELWITEGCSDCWAMLSAGHKAIAIPSATLLKESDLEPLRSLNLHMYPDQDLPGERLFVQLRTLLPQLQRHQLPTPYKDFGEYYAYYSQSLLPQ